MATRKTPPSFPFYVEDYLAGTKKLSLAAKGAYVDCLCHQWHADEGIPTDDPKELAAILRCTPASAKAVWPIIATKFRLIDDEGRARNERLEDEREKKRRYYETQAENGAKGGRPPVKPNPPVSQQQTDGLPETKPEGLLPLPLPVPADQSGQREPRASVISIAVGPPEHHRGPKRHGTSLMPGVAASVAALVRLGDDAAGNPRVLEIPEGWAKRARNDYRLTPANVDQFAAWLGDRLRAAGGTVDDGGKRFPWLDQMLALWRTPAEAPMPSAREWVERKQAEVAAIQATPESSRAALEEGFRRGR